MSTLGLAKNAAGKVEGHEIFLKNLAPSTTEAKLLGFFATAGEIVGQPRLMMDGRTGECKGLGWITFATDAGIAEALSWNGSSFEGRRISVTAAKQIHTGIRPTLQAPGTHTPALCEEVVRKMVSPNPGGVYIDGTFGRGGHSRAMLKALSPGGRLHAFDLDPEAIVVGKQLMKEDSRFTIHHAPFSSMRDVLKPLGIRPAGAFMDLGISSPQFDDAHRGFRPEADGPLDLRFDNSRGVPASQWLLAAPREELVRVIEEYGETTDPAAARRIADAICIARSRGELPTRTREFAAFVALAKGKEYQAMHPAKLTFQALRVHLNDEFGEIRHGIRAAYKLLGEGGRIGLLTWKHSECAIVVEVFRTLEAVRDKVPLLKWYRAQKGATALPESWSLEMDDVVRPSERELATNSRSRSALLHVLRKRRLPRMAQLEQLAVQLPAWSEVEAPVDELPAAAKRCAASASPQEGTAKRRKREESGASAAALAPAAAPSKVSKWPCKLCGELGHAASECPRAGGCRHCGRTSHTTKRCIFGAKPSERFLPCPVTGPRLSCFWRRFIVPLSRADAPSFDPADPRTSGRADVGMRCVAAGLFRSQGLRHNSQVCLSFEASGHTLEVSGALARGLVPDEGAIALRARAGLDVLLVGGDCSPPDPEEEPEAWCASPLRGLEARKRSTLAALKAAVRRRKHSADEEEAEEERIALLILDADGVFVGEACKQLRTGAELTGLVALIGDHRGLQEADVSAFAAAAEAAGAEVLRVSLGGTTLLGSHAIAILQHYLDEHLHRCEVAQQVDYGRGR